MAITFPNVIKAVGSGVTSVTTSGVTTTTGSTFALFCSWGSAGTAVPSDSKSNTYTQIAALSKGVKHTSWYKTNGTGGSGHTGTVTFNASEYPVLYFVEMAGAAASSYDGTSLATDQSADLNSITSGTLAQADSAVLTWYASGSGGARTYAASGYTVSSETDGDNYWTSAVGRKTVSATTPVNATWTLDGGSTVLGIVAFKAAAGGTAYNLTVDPASYSLTAATETVQVARALTVASTSYGVTAQPVNLAVGRVLSVSPASYSLSAADVTLTYAAAAKELVIDPANYALSAQPMTVAATRALSVDPAAYNVVNSAVTLSVGRVVSANAVSYSLTASPVTLTVARALSVDPAAYVLSAPAVTLEYRSANPVLSVDPVNYVLSLQDVGLSVAQRTVEPIWPGPYGKKRRGGTESYLERLLGRPLDEVEEEIEPEAVEVIERAVESAPVKVTKTAAKRSLKEYGLAYKEAYVEIYLELAERQRREDEEVAAAIVALL